MRRLLLLLLAFLLPLQLLAAPVGELAPVRACQAPTAQVGAQPQVQSVPAGEHAGMERVSGLPADQEQGQGGDDDTQNNATSKQIECEDHAMPALSATPALHWQPFPHAFTAPSGGASFVRDQLHPPPLG